MEHTRKMVVVPAETESAASMPIATAKPTAIRHPFEKLMKQLKIILKLARIDAYDLDGHIRGADSSMIYNSDILHLLSHAMTPGRLLIGESDFLKLLHAA